MASCILLRSPRGLFNERRQAGRQAGQGRLRATVSVAYTLERPGDDDVEKAWWMAACWRSRWRPGWRRS